MSNNEPPVDKREALQLLNKHLKKPGVIDLSTFIELLIWHNKLTLWILQEYGCPNRKKLKLVKDELTYLRSGLKKLNNI